MRPSHGPRSFFVVLVAFILLLVAAFAFATRIPTVGGDINNWGTLLNEFLLLEHTAGGAHGNVTAQSIYVPRIYSDRTNDADFTVVLWPDTQGLPAGNYSTTFNTMAQWVCDNKDSNNIKAVVSLGDIVDSPTDAQEQIADAAYDILDGCSMPYAPTIGNHDYQGFRNATKYNEYFGPSRFSGKAWYGSSSYPANSNENHYIIFTVGGKTYVVLALEFYPRAAALTWAQGIVDANPTAQFIVATHAYMYPDDTRTKPGDHYSAEDYGLGADNDGEELWNNFIKLNKQIFIVVNGHFLEEPWTTEAGVTGFLADVGDNGTIVYQMLSNYQQGANGGNGWFRILTFRPSLGTIDVKTYSANLSTYANDSRNQFTFSWPEIAVGDVIGYSSDMYSLGGIRTRGELIVGGKVRVQPNRTGADTGDYFDISVDSGFPPSYVSLDTPNGVPLYIGKLHGGSLYYDPLNTGLLLYLPFSEGSGNTTSDKSGNENNGSFVGSPAWLSRSFGYALSFNNNSGDMVTVASTSSLSGLTKITASAWAKTTSAIVPSNSQLVSKHGGGTTGEFLLTLMDLAYVRFTIVNTGTSRVDCDKAPPFSINDGNWHHYAGTYDGSVIRVYADGMLLGNCTQTGVIQTTSIAIKVAGYQAAASFTGSVDEVRIYNRTLNPSEILQLYQFGKGEFLPWPGRLVATGSINISAGGTNQSITLTPSGNGSTILVGTVNITGSVFVGTSSFVCNSGNEGRIFFNASSKQFLGCNGTGFVTL